MNYAVADIAVALDSISQICDSGAEVIFRADGGSINKTDGTVVKFERRGDSYLRRIKVDITNDITKTPFKRQGPDAS